MYEYNVETFEGLYAWHTDQGQKASTTGNIYGIYDLSGGAWEYVASYVDNGHAYLTSRGGTLTDETNMHTKQVYKASASDGTSDTRAENYALNSAVYGDAVYETSKSSDSSSGSWHSDYSSFPYTSTPFFVRGVRGSNGGSAGVFAFRYVYGGTGIDYGFRAVLCVSSDN